GARQLAVTNAGTIPDRGLYGVHLPDGRRVGELDEEMVYEARPGQTFLLGATTWRIEQITRDRVIVTPAPGVPGAVPFWKGDGVGRPAELGKAIGAFAREAVAADPKKLAGSALFGARFRENASRSLLIPRAYPGKRTPLWQQRLKAQSLLEVAREHPRFPVVLETYRECLRDVLDVPALVELLRELGSRKVSLVEVETPTASPFASSLLFDYVATYMYEGDTPNAERRA